MGRGLWNLLISFSNLCPILLQERENIRRYVYIYIYLRGVCNLCQDYRAVSCEGSHRKCRQSSLQVLPGNGCSPKP